MSKKKPETPADDTAATGAVTEATPGGSLQDNQRSWLSSKVEAFVPLARKGLNVPAFIEASLESIRYSPKVADAVRLSPDSFLRAAKTAMMGGYLPGLECYFIPRWNKSAKGEVINFQLGYRGVMKRLREGGLQVRPPRLVYKGDTLMNLSGTRGGVVVDELTVSSPVDLTRKDEDIVGGCLWWTAASGESGGVFVSRETFERARKASGGKSGNINPVWRDDFPAMCLKSVVIHGAKFAPVDTDTIAFLRREESELHGVDADESAETVTLTPAAKGGSAVPETGAATEAAEPGSEPAEKPAVKPDTPPATDEGDEALFKGGAK